MPLSLPITVIGGYLGSGKTTLVNHLLRNADGLRLAVLVNEFGELPIDNDLIEAKSDNMISIAGGCVCCSFGNDLTLALMDLHKLDPKPQHVLLEASGVALPHAIASSVSLLNNYTIDGVIVLTNVETVQMQAGDAYIADTITRQIESADLILANKMDLVNKSDLQNTLDWLKEQAPQAEIIRSTFGRLPLDIIIGHSRSIVGIPLQPANNMHHSDAYATLHFPMQNSIDITQLAEALSHQSLGIIRAKGFIYGEDGTLTTLQMVGRRWQTNEAPKGAKPGLVIIGHKAHLLTTEVENAILAVG